MISPLYRNESISKQFCACFLNNSSRLNTTQVIGQPAESLPNCTKVNFTVILRPVSASKRLVVVNAILEHIIRERANFISKHLNKTVLLNNLHPPSDTPCGSANGEKEGVEEKTKGKNIAKAIGITSFVVILIVPIVVAVWCR